MATNNTTTRKDFDFDAYNAVMKGANAGLKLFLATQLLGDVATTAFRYRNPLAQELINTVDELETLRNQWKTIAERALRQTPVGQPATQADTPVADRGEFQPAIY
jgi:hypothetical protein